MSPAAGAAGCFDDRKTLAGDPRKSAYKQLQTAPGVLSTILTVCRVVPIRNVIVAEPVPIDITEALTYRSAFLSVRVTTPLGVVIVPVPLSVNPSLHLVYM